MKKPAINNIETAKVIKNSGCLSCGTTEDIKRRRYCSVECRQKLRRTLNIRTGLLKALNTRFAVFYFTENMIVMDVLPYGSKEIFSFLYQRTAGKKPVDDFCRMADMLGNAWWAERKRTNKKYLASQHVFDQAQRNSNTQNAIKPLEIKIPSVKGKSLIHLKLGKADLNSPELPGLIAASVCIKFS